MKKRLQKPVFISFFLLWLCCLHAQTKDTNEKCFSLHRIDSIPAPGAKRGKAAVETAGINVGIWAFNRYLMREDFAKINFKTMGNNLSHGFVWDNDQFSTNLLGHPYHGGLYFNAARVNGMNFWQSVPYTVAGSLMWEYLMENEYPSINDFIATPVGGMALGEITFRLSGLLIDNRATGWSRVGREFLSTLISPMSGLNRILSGEAWKTGNYHRGAVGNDMPVKFYIEAGHRALAEESEIKNRIDNTVFLDLQLLYGNLFRKKTKNLTMHFWWTLRSIFFQSSL
ncbi:MAG: DUF3943 domain-containing protein [Bacteroidales bacterium]|jgi:hypothetical protein|nr:DUF3943 domain-containing protein [Bacteroidales bacterium]